MNLEVTLDERWGNIYGAWWQASINTFKSIKCWFPGGERKWGVRRQEAESTCKNTDGHNRQTCIWAIFTRMCAPIHFGSPCWPEGGDATQWPHWECVEVVAANCQRSNEGLGTLSSLNLPPYWEHTAEKRADFPNSTTILQTRAWRSDSRHKKKKGSHTPRCS